MYVLLALRACIVRAHARTPACSQVPLEHGQYDWHSTAQNVSAKLGGVSVKHAQVSSILGLLGHTIVSQYQPIFGLSNEQLKDLSEYASLYAVLRRCCGIEASRSWREYLQGQVAQAPSRGGVKSEHLCQMYDLDAVERAMMRSNIYVRFGHTAPVKSPHGFSDFELNGTTCTSLNRRFANKRFDRKYGSVSRVKFRL